MNESQNSLNIFRNGKNKDNRLQAQLQVVFDTLYRKPATMLMVSVETGIMRANICRYIDTLRKQNNIYLIRKGICPISKYSKVGFYTTNPELIPANNQLKLF
ncbi:MAG: hypothetical protein HOB05_05460 [Bacteroidetes bacterium]|jgi:hypothetical protein|nr:hypothetical protein [Bacteroidota bacterium]MBT7143944.1 hypothetical protein [Bacteroidota bacterium]